MMIGSIEILNCTKMKLLYTTYQINQSSALLSKNNIEIEGFLHKAYNEALFGMIRF